MVIFNCQYNEYCLFYCAGPSYDSHEIKHGFIHMRYIRTVLSDSVPESLFFLNKLMLKKENKIMDNYPACILELRF